MKILLLISWAIGFAQSDRLDRTYLPPPSSGTAGGYHGDLNLPLEIPKENYPLTLDLGRDRIIVDSSLTSNYPHPESEINTQVPSAVSSESFTNEPGISVSKTIYNVPSNTTSYAFTQTTDVFPVETYDRVPVTAVPQGYSSTSSPFDPNLSYEQYLVQQILDPNTAQEIFSYMDPDVSGINLSNDNISQSSTSSQFGKPNPKIETFQQLPNKIPIGVNIGEYVSGQSDKIGGSAPKRTNIDNRTSSNIIPQSVPKITFPTNQFGDNLDSIPLVSIPTKNYYFPNKTNQQNLETYPSLQQDTNKFDAAEIISLDSIKPGFSSTISTDEIRAGTSKPTVAVTTTSSIPTHSTPNDSLNTNFNKDLQPQRVQADADRNAVIINYKNILTPDSFAYSFDTSNGIHADESGTAIDGVKAIGSYSFIGDDGKVYSIEYTADEKGFIPRGDHLPTAPPIPDVILRGIEEAEKQKQLGIIDDGSYDDAKYGHERYQGFLRRIPQHRINDDIISKSGTRANALPNKLVSSEGMHMAANHRKNSEDISFAHDVGKMFNPANQIKMMEAYKEVLPKFTDSSKPIDNKNLKSNDLEDLNDRVIVVPKNKLGEKFINSNPKIINEHKEENSNENNDTIFTNSGVFSPVRRIFTKGYEYTQPQNIFNENDGNRLQSQFSNTKGDASNPDDETTRNTTPQAFVTKNVSYNFKGKKPDSNTQILRTNFNDPFTMYGSINSFEDPKGNFDQPRASTLYSKKTDKINFGEIPVKDINRVFTTHKPAYTSTTLGSNDYQSPDISTVDVNRRLNYPSTSHGMKLFVSTTPLPPEISSRFTSSLNNLIFPQTTPTTTFSTSTLRPSITSGKSGNTSQGLGLKGTGSGDTVDSKLINKNQNRFDQRLTGRPGYQRTTQSSPVPQNNFYGDFKARFGVSTDPPSQSIASAPDDFDRPSPTEKIIGEDFSGPKQLPKFDPHNGYYY